MVTRLGDAPAIKLGDLFLNVGVIDTGADWHAAITSGWDSTGVRPLTVTGELVDGDHWQPGFYASRSMTVQGYARLTSPSNAGLRALRERWESLTMAVGRLLRMQVTEAIGGTTVTRDVDVYTIDRPQVVFEGCQTMSFAVGLSAPDGRKYSQAVGALAMTDSLPYDQGETTVAATAATITLPVPGGSTTGDVLEAFLDVAGNVTAAPAGWTHILSQSYVGGRTQYLYRRVAGGAEPANYVWTLAGSFDHTGVMVRVSNSDTAQVGVTAMDGSSSAANLVWPAHSPAPRSLRIFGAGYTAGSAIGIPPSFLIFRSNPATAGSATYVAVGPRATGATDTVATTVPIVPQRANGRIAVNAPPLVGSTMLSIGGTAPVSPVLTVAGPAASPIIICNWDQCVRFDVALAAGDVLVADFATRRVTVNGLNRYTYVMPGSSWWQLTPGLNYIDPLVSDLEFDTDIAALWELYDPGSVSRSTQVSNSGTASLEVVIGDAGDNVVRSLTRPGIVAGQTYAVAAVMRPRSTVRDVAIRIAWIDSRGFTISYSSGATTTETAAPLWTTLTTSAVAPAGAISAALEVRIDAAGLGEAHFIDQAAMYLTAVPVSYDTGHANAIDYSGGGVAVLSWTEADW